MSTNKVHRFDVRIRKRVFSSDDSGECHFPLSYRPHVFAVIKISEEKVRGGKKRKLKKKKLIFLGIYRQKKRVTKCLAERSVVWFSRDAQSGSPCFIWRSANTASVYHDGHHIEVCLTSPPLLSLKKIFLSSCDSSVTDAGVTDDTESELIDLKHVDAMICLEHWVEGAQGDSTW